MNEGKTIMVDALEIASDYYESVLKLAKIDAPRKLNEVSDMEMKDFEGLTKVESMELECPSLFARVTVPAVYYNESVIAFTAGVKNIELMKEHMEDEVFLALNIAIILFVHAGKIKPEALRKCKLIPKVAGCAARNSEYPMAYDAVQRNVLKMMSMDDIPF